MDSLETIETVDLTDTAQIDEDPVISSLPEPEPDPEQVPDEQIEGVEEIAIDEEVAEEEPEILADAESDVPEEKVPEVNDEIGAKIANLESLINGLTETLNAMTSRIENINRLEEERAAGPQGFFKPIDDAGNPQPTSENARIIRKYF